ncbi:MAG: hypothetical protein WED15_01120 [Akkermansiaceae bacterium]
MRKKASILSQATLWLTVFAVAWIGLSEAAEPTSSDERKTIMILDFLSENARLLRSGDFVNGKYRKLETKYGKLPRSRFEGTTLSGRKVGPETVQLVPSFSPETGQAIRYTLGPQGKGSKARSEHYLQVGEMDRTYCSEFSMMLDPNMTVAEKRREYDGGQNWVILRQWHQSAPESPPIALALEGGTNNVIVTSIRYGDHQRASSRIFRGRKPLELGKWYHFRFRWHVAPGTDKSRLKVWVSDERWGDDLRESDVLFDYHGPIGYTLKGKPASEITRNSYTLREQQGIYQGGHLAKDAFHALSIANVRIYQTQ